MSFQLAWQDSAEKTTLTTGLVRIFVKGGIISPGVLLGILKVVQAMGLHYIHLGSRQDILFPVEEGKAALLPGLLDSLPLPYEYQERDQQNIVSSYVTHDIVSSTRWLAPHIYHYVFDSFDYVPTHKINITDPLQGMVPLFTGNINFIASSVDNYWYLYLRYAEIGAKPWCCPDFIHGCDLAKVAKAVEEINLVENQVTYAELYQRLKDKINFSTQPIGHPLKYPDSVFPYYEGINLMEGNTYWLGLYWRDNRFNTKFLQALCQQCLANNISNIGLTPWKSIIVKGITDNNRLAWEKLLGKYGINMRHSSIELNWHLPVADNEALELKNYLVRVLDQRDISTYGLTFSVKTKAHKILFTSVVIERAIAGEESSLIQYNILYAKNFNPNLFEFIYYARAVSKEIIPSLLIELSKKYYEQLNARTTASPKSNHSPASASVLVDRQVYQCAQCLRIYDSLLGDPAANIPPETDFYDLPENYCCSICGSDKDSFREIPWTEL